MSFGQTPNNSTCDCGEHYGTGQWSHEKRYVVYRRLNDKTPDLMTMEQRAYMKTYERKHGELPYTMVQHGMQSGAFKPGTKQTPLMIAEPDMLLARGIVSYDEQSGKGDFS